MSVRDVKNALTRVASDNKLDVKDVDSVLSELGSISPDEVAELRKQVDAFSGSLDPDAARKLSDALGALDSQRQRAASINSRVEYQKSQLTADMTRRLEPNTRTESFGGTVIPEAVKQVVRDALAAGATAYDVREMKPNPIYDTAHGEGHVALDGKFNPYAQEQRAVDSLAFDHTELTPEKIEKDMNTVQTYKVLTGYEKQYGQEVATFKEVSGKGSGDITALYDEASWPETFARARGGQKYANNFAILADGSVHCVPASRRSAGEPNRILTTASLARGQLMLFNGHLDMRAGVVTYVGMSGRLCKLQQKNEAKFVDPLELLKAWGFKLAPGLTVTEEG